MNKKEQQALDRVLAAGASLSNIAYNAAQDADVPEYLRQRCDEWRREWDEARSDYRKVVAERRSTRKQRTA